MRRVAPAHLMLLLLAAVPMRGPSAQVLRDSAGVSIISIDLDKPRGSRLSALPVVAIGDSDVEREQLFRVTSVARLGDGSIVVANNGTSSLKIFDRTGRFLRELGRRGQGPAEFGNIERVWILPGDTIVAADSRRRLVFFTSSGERRTGRRWGKSPAAGEIRNTRRQRTRAGLCEFLVSCREYQHAHARSSDRRCCIDRR